MKHLFYKAIILIVFLGAGVESRAERGDTLINPYFELIRLMGHYDNDSMFTIDQFRIYDYADSSGNHVYDSVQVTYTVLGQKYQCATDTTEEVQNDLYNVKVDNVDSTIIIAPPQPVFPLIVQADLLDQTFQPYMTNIHVVDSGMLRNILVDFQLSSPYYNYLMAYDSVMDFIAVKYTMRNHIPLTPTGSYTIIAPANDYTALLMSVFITMPSPRPADPFNTDKYFTRVGNVFTPKAPYANYEIINLLSNQ